MSRQYLKLRFTLYLAVIPPLLLSLNLTRAQQPLLQVVHPEHPLILENTLSEVIRYPLWGAVFYAPASFEIEAVVSEQKGDVNLLIGAFVFPINGETNNQVWIEIEPRQAIIVQADGERTETRFNQALYEIGQPLGIDLEFSPQSMLSIEELKVTPEEKRYLLNDSLRTLAEAQGVTLGVATDIYPPLHDLQYEHLLAQQAGLLAPTEFYWTTTRPSESIYYFLPADMMVNFALVNQQRIRGYHLIWDFELPLWLTRGKFSDEYIETLMKEHITVTMDHFQGRVSEWVVVNEAVWGTEVTKTDTAEFAQNLWYEAMGEDYIQTAFYTAREADPDAILIYNEDAMEEINPKSDFVYKMMQDYLEQGVPVDAIGLQMHLDAAHPPSSTSVIENMERFANLGLEIVITELDVNLANLEGTEAEQLEVQAAIYQQMLEACLQVSACKSYTLWSLSDRYAWVEFGAASPAILDEFHQPKPAYVALIEKFMILDSTP